MENRQLDVAVIGCGPHGLAVSAHLSAFRPRLRSCVFGEPMRTWRRLMPPGMKLRSTWTETSFPSPGDRGSVSAWARAAGRTLADPPALEDFIAYADWFREELAGPTDELDVTGVRAAPSGFILRTGGGAEVPTRSIVIAVGVTPFGRVPHAFAALVGDPGVSFATELTDFSCFEGKRVLVLGGGQGALEAALWCVRAGAETNLAVRSSVNWFADREPWRERTRMGQRLHELAYPVVGYGPPLVNRLAIRPGAYARLPADLRRKLTARILRSGGSPWLREEVERGARIQEGAEVLRAERTSEGLSVGLSNGSRLVADHVLLGTGYAFELDRLSFLDHGLRSQIATLDGFPRLDLSYQSSVPDLHFVGYAAEGRFGPAARFVLGARHAAPAAARSAARTDGHTERGA